YNMRFVGNPGTGKTTIARYMARVFTALGIIDHPNVKEYRGVDLKGSFVGQTKDKVNEIFENSSGYVVVIDEIYSLCNSHNGQSDTFGQEAVDTLTGGITDLKNAATIFVIAGYKERMEDFLQCNPGLARRFPLEVNFPDYSNEECVLILKKMLSENGYVCPESAEFELRMGESFGNAGSVGGIFSAIENNISNRVLQLNDPTEDDLRQIKLSDLPDFEQ
ncbi:MAG: AAA family ATPase, partial [Victivallaceae bacterium]